MKSIRKDKDILVIWSNILLNGTPADLGSLNVRLVLSGSRGNRFIPILHKTTGSLQARISGKWNLPSGVYTLTLWLNYGLDNQSAIDKVEAFRYVDTTDEESGEDPENLTCWVPVNLEGGNFQVLSYAKQVPADWQENDESSPSHVFNRPGMYNRTKTVLISACETNRDQYGYFYKKYQWPEELGSFDARNTYLTRLMADADTPIQIDTEGEYYSPFMVPETNGNYVIWNADTMYRPGGSRPPSNQHVEYNPETGEIIEYYRRPEGMPSGLLEITAEDLPVQIPMEYLREIESILEDYAREMESLWEELDSKADLDSYILYEELFDLSSAEFTPGGVFKERLISLINTCVTSALQDFLCGLDHGPSGQVLIMTPKSKAYQTAPIELYVDVNGKLAFRPFI